MAKAKSKPNKLSDQLRQAIAESGSSRYRIAQETGIDESALAKFFNGQRGLSLPSLDALVEYLGLELVQKDASPKGKSGGK